MPERRPAARILGVLAGGLLAGVLLAPAALAQTDEIPPPESPESPEPPVAPPEGDPEGRWTASSFDAPFDDPALTLRAEPFTVAGTLRYEKRGPTDHIVGALVRIVDDPSDDFTPGDGCSLPEPAIVPGDDSWGDFQDELRFMVEDVFVGCNGRYLAEVEARVDDPEAPAYVMRRSFVLGVLPAAVTELSVALDADARAATIEFTPLDDDQLAPDAVGYAVERAGPRRGGDFGAYEDVAVLGLDESRHVDDLGAVDGGEYSYRVRSLRDGPDGPVRASIIDTKSAAITLEGPARSDTSTTGIVDRSSSRGGRVVSRSRSTTTRRAVTRQTTPTTLDTGFEETIDYGDDTRDSELAGDEPLAGQSIVRDEGEPVDLAVPAAGALVLLGWAGHIVYLNRLARQL